MSNIYVQHTMKAGFASAANDFHLISISGEHNRSVKLLARFKIELLHSLFGNIQQTCQNQQCSNRYVEQIAKEDKQCDVLS